MDVIYLKGVKKRYSKQNTVTFPEIRVKRGRCTFLTGSNGKGKSTLIKLVLSHITPTQYEVFFVANIKMNYVPEVFILPYGIRVKTFLSCMCHLLNQDYPHTLLTYFEIKDHHYTQHLSKGMRQKVGLVLAFLKKASIIVLDEPYSGLDARMRDKLDYLIQDYVKKGMTFLISTHTLSQTPPFSYDEISL